MSNDLTKYLDTLRPPTSAKETGWGALGTLLAKSSPIESSTPPSAAQRPQLERGRRAPPPTEPPPTLQRFGGAATDPAADEPAGGGVPSVTFTNAQRDQYEATVADYARQFHRLLAWLTSTAAGTTVDDVNLLIEDMLTTMTAICEQGSLRYARSKLRDIANAFAAQAPDKAAFDVAADCAQDLFEEDEVLILGADVAGIFTKAWDMEATTRNRNTAISKLRQARTRADSEEQKLPEDNADPAWKGLLGQRVWDNADTFTSSPPSWSPSFLQLARAAFGERSSTQTGGFDLQLAAKRAKDIQQILPGTPLRFSGEPGQGPFLPNLMHIPVDVRAWLLNFLNVTFIKQGMVQDSFLLAALKKSLVPHSPAMQEWNRLQQSADSLALTFHDVVRAMDKRFAPLGDAAYHTWWNRLDFPDTMDPTVQLQLIHQLLGSWRLYDSEPRHPEYVARKTFFSMSECFQAWAFQQTTRMDINTVDWATLLSLAESYVAANGSATPDAARSRHARSALSALPMPLRRGATRPSAGSDRKQGSGKKQKGTSNALKKVLTSILGSQAFPKTQAAARKLAAAFDPTAHGRAAKSPCSLCMPDRSARDHSASNCPHCKDKDSSDGTYKALLAKRREHVAVLFQRYFDGLASGPRRH